VVAAPVVVLPATPGDPTAPLTWFNREPARFPGAGLGRAVTVASHSALPQNSPSNRQRIPNRPSLQPDSVNESTLDELAVDLIRAAKPGLTVLRRV